MGRTEHRTLACRAALVSEWKGPPKTLAMHKLSAQSDICGRVSKRHKRSRQDHFSQKVLHVLDALTSGEMSAKA